MSYISQGGLVTMSLTRLAARIAGCLAVFVVVIAAYNFAAYLLVQKVISQTKTASPLPITKLEINFDGSALEGLHDGYYNYQPERERPGHRFGDR